MDENGGRGVFDIFPFALMPQVLNSEMKDIESGFNSYILKKRF